MRQVAEVPGESGPDHRSALADEHTFLAWQRTALSSPAGVAAQPGTTDRPAVPGELAPAVLGVLVPVLCPGGAPVVLVG